VSALFRTNRAGDFDRLYRRHAPGVYRYAFAVLGNSADAEDVTQQTFLNAYRAILHGTKPRKTENWLLRIAHNEVRRHFRTNGKAVEVEFDERIAAPARERGEPGLADVLRGLQQLPPMQRSALVMREFEGRTYAEIAETLGISQSALETLIFRARRGLAEELEGDLSCEEAEQALSRRLDGRLARREARRLKQHLHDCRSCVRFGEIQKRQRTLLKGLSIMPIPASLFVFRGEQAAAGLGVSAAVTGSTAVGAGGMATGLAAKAAAVAATAVVAGGTGYGVVTQVAGAPPKKPQVVRAAAPSALSGAPAASPIRATRAGVRQTPSVAHPRNKRASGATKRAGKADRLKQVPVRRGWIPVVRAQGKARPHLASPAASRPKAKVKAPHAPTRPPRGKKPNLPRRGGPKPQEEKEKAAKTKPPPAAGLPGRAR
jgi:RNA polymerase sigma-70 factor (ECF subfamily)